MKIVVLAAGTSTEREVSIVSGTNVCKALRSKGHQAILVDVFFGKEGADSATAFDGDYDVDAEAAYISSFNDQVKDAVASGREFFGPGVIELCKAADVVFMALHGANGEDGRVQAYFDLCGIPYTGTGYLSSAMAMDKGITKKIFLTSGVPTPRGVELKKGKDSTNLADHNMELPVVVKTCCGGSSVGVYITKTPEEYEEALQGAFSYEDEVVVEEYIECENLQQTHGICPSGNTQHDRIFWFDHMESFHIYFHFLFCFPHLSVSLSTSTFCSHLFSPYSRNEYGHVIFCPIIRILQCFFQQMPSQFFRHLFLRLQYHLF